MKIPGLGIPALRMADGPAGIRMDRQSVNEGKATSWPAPIALAAAWDPATAEQYGDLMGQETRATGHSVLLGPGLDIARLPTFGRLFEAFGEDPVLTGHMAARYIQGVQRHPVIATAKHYNVNAQEENRLVVDAQFDERTLQEIYTLPFEAAMKDGHAGAVMGAYEQDLLVQEVAAANPRTIVVLATGGPIVMPWLEQVPAVLESWYGGQELGNALADVLFGDVNPAGKLPVTFPRSDRDTPVSEPSQYSRNAPVARFSEGLAVGYRGYDQFGIEPLFPFGHGLSYTDFAYSQLQVEPEITDGARPIQVSFTLTNTRSRAGAEVTQVYLGLPANMGEPPKRLIGWAKIYMEPGESREVNVTLDPSATSRPLSYWNVNTNGWEIASGDYQVYVGASSRDIRLTGSFHVRRVTRE